MLKKIVSVFLMVSFLVAWSAPKFLLHHCHSMDVTSIVISDTKQNCCENYSHNSCKNNQEQVSETTCCQIIPLEFIKNDFSFSHSHYSFFPLLILLPDNGKIFTPALELSALEIYTPSLKFPVSAVFLKNGNFRL